MWINFYLAICKVSGLMIRLLKVKLLSTVTPSVNNKTKILWLLSLIPIDSCFNSQNAQLFLPKKKILKVRVVTFLESERDSHRSSEYTSLNKFLDNYLILSHFWMNINIEPPPQHLYWKSVKWFQSDFKSFGPRIKLR